MLLQLQLPVDGSSNGKYNSRSAKRHLHERDRGEQVESWGPKKRGWQVCVCVVNDVRGR